MLIKSLRLHNFGIISEHNFTFNEGIIVFSGNNGEGKSTVLKSISMILFNHYGGRLASYIKWGEEEGNIECDFIHKGKSYTTTMLLKKKGSERYFKDNDSGREIFSTSGVVEMLEALFDTKRMIASVISFEHEVDLITTLPSERREYLKSIYDLSFRKILERIKIKLEYIEKELDNKKRDKLLLEGKVFEYHNLSRPAMSEESFKKLLTDIQSNDIIIENKGKELEGMRKQLGELRMSERMIEEYEKEIKSLEKEIKDLTNKLELDNIELETKEKELNDKKDLDYKRGVIQLFKEVDVLIIKADELESEIEADEVMNRAGAELKELEGKVDKITGEVVELEGIITQSQAEKDKFEVECGEARLELKLKEHEASEIRNKIRMFKDGKCPLCEGEIGEGDIQTLFHNLRLLEKEISVIEERISEEYKARRSKLESCLREARKGCQERHSYLDRVCLKNILERLKGMTAVRHEALAVQTFTQSRKTEILSTKKRILHSQERQNEIVGKRDKLKDTVISTLLPLDTTVKELEQLVSELEALNSQNKAKEKSYKEIAERNRIYEELNKATREKEKVCKKEIGELTKLVDNLEGEKTINRLADKVFSRQFPTYVLNNLVQSLGAYANEFLSKVYPQYKLSFTESNNSLLVHYNDVDVRFASGYEKQIFSFAYKYAIGKLQMYDILLLDEVDSSASQENSVRFFEALIKMTQFFKQIFIITHKEEVRELLKGDADASVYVFNKGGVSCL